MCVSLSVCASVSMPAHLCLLSLSESVCLRIMSEFLEASEDNEGGALAKRSLADHTWWLLTSQRNLGAALPLRLPDVQVVH